MEAPARSTSLPELLETQSKTLRAERVGVVEGRPIRFHFPRKPSPPAACPLARSHLRCLASALTPPPHSMNIHSLSCIIIHSLAPLPCPLACIVMQCGRWSWRWSVVGGRYRVAAAQVDRVAGGAVAVVGRLPVLLSRWSGCAG